MITQAQIIKSIIEENAPLTTGQMLKTLVYDDVNSEQKKQMAKGELYYRARNDITKRRITYYVHNEQMEDISAANNKLAHGFHKILVDQKVAYIAGNPVVFNTDDEGFLKEIEEVKGHKFDTILTEWIKGASNKGVEYLHVFFNTEGKFDYVIIDAKEIIPIYDSSYQKNLIGVIRYYKIEVYEGKRKVDRYYLEWWTDTEVTYYVQNEKGEFDLDISRKVNPAPHWFKIDPASNEVVSGGSWGKVPFIPLPNNDEQMSDLDMVKSLIDDYDLNTSDMSNNLADLQEAIWKLKGYEGTSLAEFKQNLRTYKAIKLAEDGDAEADRMDIPYEARDRHLKRLEEDIFTFGMGLNIKTDRFGNAPSGIALKFMYSLLDLKANIMIRKIKLALREFVWFIAKAVKEMKNKEYDPDSVTFTFNKSMMFNEAEKIQMARDSKGVISDETILENHPWVDDVKAEKDRIENEQGIYGALE